MRNAFANKISYFILTFLFLIIVASFLFSNFDNFSMSSSQDVATIDGTPVTIKEYSTALNRQVEFYNQMMGGNGLTQKQLEQMGIKQNVLNGLIQQKLLINAAKQMGFLASIEEVKNEIKSLPYFKKNDQFDVSLYRAMLQGNGFNPSQFEELIENDLKQKKVEELLNSTLLSEQFVTDVVKYKNIKVIIQGIKISRQSLSPLISVTADEITGYLSNPENKKSLETTYSENYSKYNKPEEVKARHILIKGQDEKALQKINSIKAKVTTSNFSNVAKKETEEESGKMSGGDLGWFAKGRMVPEFEEVAFRLKKGEISSPVKTQFGYHIIYLEDKKSAQTQTLETVQSELARIELQKTKSQDLDKLLASMNEKIKSDLENNNFESVKDISKKIDVQVLDKKEINQLDLELEGVSLSPSDSEQIFKSTPGTVVNLGNAGSIFLVKILELKKDPASEKEFTEEKAKQDQIFSRKVREEFIRDLNNKARIVTNERLL